MTNFDYIIRDLEPHVPSVPTSANDIAKRVGLWSERSIALGLLHLWKMGKVRRRADDAPNHSGRAPRNLYWRDAS